MLLVPGGWTFVLTPFAYAMNTEVKKKRHTQIIQKLSLSSSVSIFLCFKK